MSNSVVVLVASMFIHLDLNEKRNAWNKDSWHCYRSLCADELKYRNELLSIPLFMQTIWVYSYFTIYKHTRRLSMRTNRRCWNFREHTHIMVCLCGDDMDCATIYQLIRREVNGFVRNIHFKVYVLWKQIVARLLPAAYISEFVKVGTVWRVCVCLCLDCDCEKVTVNKHKISIER